MSNDDSRGLESPDRPHASTDDSRALSDTSRSRLETIDQQARTLLENVSEDSDAVRHLREIRAEVDRVRLSLLGPEAVLEDLPLEADVTRFDGGDSIEPTDTDGDVPMIASRGERVTTYLGPDPDAYEREHGDRDV